LVVSSVKALGQTDAGNVLIAREMLRRPLCARARHARCS